MDKTHQRIQHGFMQAMQLSLTLKQHHLPYKRQKNKRQKKLRHSLNSCHKSCEHTNLVIDQSPPKQLLPNLWVDCCQGIRRTVKRPNCAGGVRRGSNELLASHAHVTINTAQDLVVGELVVCGVFHALLSSFT